MSNTVMSRAFAFDTSTQVLAFSVRAAELTDAAAVSAHIQPSFGSATVTLACDRGAQWCVIEELDAAAADIRHGPPPGAEQAASRTTWQTRLVSVVDDDPSICKVLHHCLSFGGFAAETYTSATAFIEARAWQRCRLVITDMEMPGIDGLQLLGHLGEQGVSVPVLMLTGNPDPDLREKALAAGAVSFMQKPFDVRTLLCEVRALSD